MTVLAVIFGTAAALLGVLATVGWQRVGRGEAKQRRAELEARTVRDAALARRRAWGDALAAVALPSLEPREPPPAPPADHDAADPTLVSPRW